MTGQDIVAVEADTQEIHQEQSFERDAPPSASMEDMVARDVEAALRHILIKKDFLVIKKCSPQKRKIEDEEIQDFLLGEVWCLLKDVFKIAQDADFIVHEAANHEDVYLYEYKDGPGPDLENLAFDLKNGSKTPWNSKIIDLLLEEIQKRCDEERWPFQRSEVYFREILHNHYRALAYNLDGHAAQSHSEGYIGDPCRAGEKVDCEEGQNTEGNSSNNALEKCMLAIPRQFWRRRFLRNIVIE
ncbi:hypothetical protein F4604DRAFT_1936423 [Suillus subluteus]|nr:hypothetical protein F4604DRAFT_1936423 [Suillus subluteus]